MKPLVPALKRRATVGLSLRDNERAQTIARVRRGAGCVVRVPWRQFNRRQTRKSSRSCEMLRRDPFAFDVPFDRPGMDTA
jgi:hypothetical protein